jgi:hypothetical protein
MLLLEYLAEKKIADAVERGELDDLPGAGRPLDLDDDALVPEDMRMAHRIHRNSGLDSDFPAQRLSVLERAKIEGRYFGKVLRKVTRPAR